MTASVVKMDKDTQCFPCFLSDHEGFCGTIKNSSEDFVVIEIDIHGRPVNAHPTDTLEEPIKLAKKEGRQCSLKEAKLWTGDPALDEITDGVTSVNEGLSEGVDLNGILGCSVNQALEEFVNIILGRSEEHKEDMEMTLGTFPDKPQRASVHRAVRHNYPFLMTLTDQTEIRVKEDPDFRELSELVSEKEAEDFFRFIDVKVPGSGFTFLPDNSKEHRTSVHHFISRRFGKLVETKSFMEQDRTSITVRLRERGGRGKKRTADGEEQLDTYTGDWSFSVSPSTALFLKK